MLLNRKKVSQAICDDSRLGSWIWLSQSDQSFVSPASTQPSKLSIGGKSCGLSAGTSNGHEAGNGSFKGAAPFVGVHPTAREPGVDSDDVDDAMLEPKWVSGGPMHETVSPTSVGTKVERWCHGPLGLATGFGAAIHLGVVGYGEHS